MFGCFTGLFVHKNEIGMADILLWTYLDLDLAGSAFYEEFVLIK